MNGKKKVNVEFIGKLNHLLMILIYYHYIINIYYFII